MWRVRRVLAMSMGVCVVASLVSAPPVFAAPPGAAPVGVLGLTAALCFTGAVRAFRFATSGAGGRPRRNRKATTVRDAAPETKPEVAAR
jgi:hypothetical protein